MATPSSIKRLNYIGSKYQLLDWLRETMISQTGWESFQKKRVADLFAGTGVVSLHFANLGAVVTSNDAERYSSTIVRALLKSEYTEKCKEIVQEINRLLQRPVAELPSGYITENYSPYQECRRQFFTIENAKKIDLVRSYLAKAREREEVTHDEYTFLMASLIVSADAISNVPAVYGCFLKNFKQKAKNPFVLVPLFQTNGVNNGDNTNGVSNGVTSNEHQVYNASILEAVKQMNKVDMVYLDPPYNERNYSANYFPLNMIAKTPEETREFPELKGVTGIPFDCFRSDFCKKTKVKEAFRSLFAGLKEKTDWIFLSYNSESLVTRADMIKLVKEVYPSAKIEVIEREYKRFKNFDYGKDSNDTGEVVEYLFSICTKTVV